jgi:hypothetical protein
MTLVGLSNIHFGETRAYELGRTATIGEQAARGHKRTLASFYPVTELPRQRAAVAIEGS